MKTSELTDLALDWAVDKCEGKTWWGVGSFIAYHEEGTGRYSTNWAQGGPIIEREKLDVGTYRGAWRAAQHVGSAAPMYGYGPTPLIAAMRCYVASKMGDTVELPEELK